MVDRSFTHRVVIGNPEQSRCRSRLVDKPDAYQVHFAFEHFFIRNELEFDGLFQVMIQCVRNNQRIVKVTGRSA